MFRRPSPTSLTATLTLQRARGQGRSTRREDLGVLLRERTQRRSARPGRSSEPAEGPSGSSDAGFLRRIVEGLPAVKLDPLFQSGRLRPARNSPVIPGRGTMRRGRWFTSTSAAAPARASAARRRGTPRLPSASLGEVYCAACIADEILSAIAATSFLACDLQVEWLAAEVRTAASSFSFQSRAVDAQLSARHRDGTRFYDRELANVEKVGARDSYTAAPSDAALSDAQSPTVTRSPGHRTAAGAGEVGAVREDEASPISDRCPARPRGHPRRPGPSRRSPSSARPTGRACA